MWHLNGETGYIDALGYEGRKALWKLQKRFGDVSRQDLVRYVYTFNLSRLFCGIWASAIQV